MCLAVAMTQVTCQYSPAWPRSRQSSKRREQLGDALTCPPQQSLDSPGPPWTPVPGPRHRWQPVLLASVLRFTPKLDTAQVGKTTSASMTAVPRDSGVSGRHLVPRRASMPQDPTIHPPAAPSQQQYQLGEGGMLTSVAHAKAQRPGGLSRSIL